MATGEMDVSEQLNSLPEMNKAALGRTKTRGKKETIRMAFYAKFTAAKAFSGCTVGVSHSAPS
jgi:hypothetical protein